MTTNSDPGLAAERTGLAWTRSAISFAAIGVVILRQRPLVGIPVLILSAVVWITGHAQRKPGRAGLGPRRVLFVTVCVTVIAAAALAIALAGPSPHGLRL